MLDRKDLPGHVTTAVRVFTGVRVLTGARYAEFLVRVDEGVPIAQAVGHRRAIVAGRVTEDSAPVVSLDQR